MAKPTLNKTLRTPFEDDGRDWTEYPRPQFKRDSYLSLCGEWQLSIEKKDGTEALGNILVPYPPESRISGIERQLESGERYIYEKIFALPAEMQSGRILLHFGAVDQIAEVFLNGKPLGRHEGGYLPFEFDLTDVLRESENKLTIKVTDELDRDLAWGKQRRDRGGMWYTPTSGIWQAVWLECVPENYIKAVKMTPSLNAVKFEVTGGEEGKCIVLGDRQYPFCGKEFELQIENPHLWSPDDPHLYHFTLTSGADRIESYFALRTVTVEKQNGQAYLCLNGKPYFFHGLLDQGYFSDGIYTPASPRGLESDILKMKSLGFNMLRKHIKIEHELFYYYCDKHGMTVFQDMVNSGGYSFLIDTALPTAGLKKGITHKASPRRKAAFYRDSEETLRLLYNHPSVCYYTVFNEGWGQFDADGNYDRLKCLDPTRVFDATSGWFFGKKSDVQSDHIYFKKLNLKRSPDRPMVLSEFGGYSCKIAGHVFNPDKTYGYGSFEKKEDFEEAFVKLYREEVVPMIERGLCATVYTQVSDVEDETNGILTYDRQVLKVSPERMQEVAAELRRAFVEKTAAKA